MYGGKLCPDMKQNGDCPRGDACHMTHSMFEYYMHPLRYRTKMCKDGTSCNRPFCFFAHQPSELRQPVEASTFLAMLSPQALAAAADHLISHSSSSVTRMPGDASSSSATELQSNPNPSPVQLVYQTLPPAPLQQQQMFHQQQQMFVQMPAAAAAGLISSTPVMHYSPSGVRASYGGSSSSTRLLHSPSSALSTSSGNLDTVLMLHGGSMQPSSVSSGELPGPMTAQLYQPMVAATPEIIVSPPRPMMQAVTSSGPGAMPLILSGGAAVAGYVQQQPQQQQQHAIVSDPIALAGMMGRLNLTDPAAAAAANAPATVVQGLAAALPATAAMMSPTAVQISLDEAIRIKQQQVLQQQQQLNHQLLAAGLPPTTAAEMACVPPLGAVTSPAPAADVPVSTAQQQQFLGGVGGGISHVRYESLFEAPLFSGVQW
eukprot:GHUV01002234.1.p1 GENE.GHUV01002234.1~~GHUV01002234.1.p1  ORF type:complete len:430 (+),score=186.62 GHUV01002234.1:638-1927(+)